MGPAVVPARGGHQNDQLSTGLLALSYCRDTNPGLADDARFRIGELLADCLAAG